MAVWIELFLYVLAVCYLIAEEVVLGRSLTKKKGAKWQMQNNILSRLFDIYCVIQPFFFFSVLMFPLIFFVMNYTPKIKEVLPISNPDLVFGADTVACLVAVLIGIMITVILGRIILYILGAISDFYEKKSGVIKRICN
ncbi:hypothetical protein MH050_03460 [Bacillus licheniformis]|uniref:hypothetical protein n=1 Tax=Bacillus TaxID=1386 RepID=UPI0011A4EDF2|nr:MULTISPECIES: hypothetical protein [Bacillus subtilis group]MCA1181423.1 hypothetical protein [Bacillus licheniformis]MCM3210449.1 hypothetical protein [Bacillus licheniformis]MCM3286055.1 hypothetical protein [Bacillus licheniformis]MCY7739905.1 hypothetical protein [Bacillus licheniformis]MEC2101937.1 hypothetical protein [Bacillus licheniformis]